MDSALQLLILFGAGGGVTTVVAQAIKKIFGADSEKVIKFMVFVVAALVACLPQLITHHYIPYSLLGQHAIGFYGAAELLYVFLVKYGVSFVNAIQARSDRKDLMAAQAADVSPSVAAAASLEGASVVSAISSVAAQNTNVADF